LNVVWDNYTDIAYNRLLSERFGEIDPVIPFILQEYAKNGIVISPRVAITAYTVFEKCGPESLGFIAEFAKKPSLVAEGLKKYEAAATLRDLAGLMQDHYQLLDLNPLSTKAELTSFNETLVEYEDMLKKVKSLKVSDDLIDNHTRLLNEHDVRFKALAKKAMIATTMIND
jgi:hypothetical protein